MSLIDHIEMPVEPKDAPLVAVAMSGGVDSSACAYIMAKKGFNVIGVTMKLWDAGRSGALNEKTCCTLDSSMDARHVCDTVGIPHYTLDMTRDFEDLVMEPFYQSYLDAKTPNPCVNCNSFVKWDALWNRVKSIGATHMATGHYANVVQMNGKNYITRGDDVNKDQSYFLWGIPPDALEKTIFPVMGLTKPQVRAIAEEGGLRTAKKPESMDICFIPDGDKNKFLQKRAEQKGDTFRPGKIVNEEGEVLGKHNGLPFYTIGQRKGTGVATGTPVFVKELDVKSNTLIMGEKASLGTEEFTIKDLNWFEDFSIEEMDLSVQIRYRSKPFTCKVQKSEDGLFKVILTEKAVISPGQSAVFYDDNRLLGGSTIV